MCALLRDLGSAFVQCVICFQALVRPLACTHERSTFCMAQHAGKKCEQRVTRILCLLSAKLRTCLTQWRKEAEATLRLLLRKVA